MEKPKENCKRLIFANYKGQWLGNQCRSTAGVGGREPILGGSRILLNLSGRRRRLVARKLLSIKTGKKFVQAVDGRRFDLRMIGPVRDTPNGKSRAGTL